MKKCFEKSLFDFEEYLNLFQIISSNEHGDIEIVDDALTDVRRYVEVVDTTEQQIMLASVRFDGEEYREMITRYDTARRQAHESAIAATNLLNRISSLYGCKTIYRGGEDRLEVADFCLEVVETIFKKRKM